MSCVAADSSDSSVCGENDPALVDDGVSPISVDSVERDVLSGNRPLDTDASDKDGSD